MFAGFFYQKLTSGSAALNAKKNSYGIGRGELVRNQFLFEWKPRQTHAYNCIKLNVSNVYQGWYLC